MKNPLLVCILVGALIACTKDGYLESGQYPQKWDLIKMTGQFQNSVKTGADMEWQESYLLNADHTFTKTRTSNGITKEASGTFIFKGLSGQKYIELAYGSPNDLIASCISDRNESLWLKSDNHALGTWSACDGPGLEYEKVR